MNREGQNIIKFKFFLDDLVSPNGVLAALVRANLIPGDKPIGCALDKLAGAIGIAREDFCALLLRETPRYYPRCNIFFVLRNRLSLPGIRILRKGQGGD